MREIGKVSYGKFSKEGAEEGEGVAQTPVGAAQKDANAAAAKKAAAAAKRKLTGKPGPGRPRKDKSKAPQ